MKSKHLINYICINYDSIFKIKDIYIMFNESSRKKNLQLVLNKMKDFLYFFTKNDKLSALLVIMFHYVPILYLFYIGLTTDNVLIFKILSILYFLLIGLYFYFNGCILLKLERMLLNNKKWYGLYGILSYTGFNINNKMVKFIFEMILLPFSMVCYIKQFIRLLL